ncbi:MAG: NTP transferase domain-containing protein [Leptonema sp. (in: Bacteria)]|nr:NTP transferase domain-containing protein [Leptonema sp. (in: bacteria)]
MLKSHPDRHAVILAAGKGTRMQSDLPKVAMPLNNRPMILHVLDQLLPLQLNTITIVVGYRREVVEDLVNQWKAENNTSSEIHFAIQQEQKGTAHAFLQSEAVLSNQTGFALVTAGDMPLLRTLSLETLFNEVASGASGAVLSAQLENPKGYGRMVRDSNGNLDRIVEEKDADEPTKKINEVNTGCYVFQIPEIFDLLKRIDSNNNQNEYYLPDAIRLYRQNGNLFKCVQLTDYRESMGANTRDDLVTLEEIYKQMLNRL